MIIMIILAMPFFRIDSRRTTLAVSCFWWTGLLQMSYSNHSKGCRKAFVHVDLLDSRYHGACFI